MAELTGAQSRLIDEAAAASAGSASLSDIQHVVILMQENRSFDHYFGTLSGVRGFSDPNILSQFVGGRAYPIFDQFGHQPGRRRAGEQAGAMPSQETSPKRPPVP
jgi:phospholipase C